jgi:hypothetical protein
MGLHTIVDTLVTNTDPTSISLRAAQHNYATSCEGTMSCVQSPDCLVYSCYPLPGLRTFPSTSRQVSTCQSAPSAWRRAPADACRSRTYRRTGVDCSWPRFAAERVERLAPVPSSVSAVGRLLTSRRPPVLTHAGPVVRSEVSVGEYANEGDRGQLQ